MTFIHTQPAMRFNLTIGGCKQAVAVDHRTLANTIGSNRLEDAIAKREFGEKFYDLFAGFFGGTKYEDVITAVWNVAKADTTTSLQNGVLHLASLAVAPDEFAKALTLKAGKDEGDTTSITVRLCDRPLCTVRFDGQGEWDEFYFTKSDNVWKLSDEAVQILQFRQKLELLPSKTSVALQSNILNLLTTRPDLAEDLTLKVESEEQNSLVTVSLFRIPLETMMFDGKVALDPHLFTKNAKSNDFQLNRINFKTYQPIFTKLYCVENSEHRLTCEVKTKLSKQQNDEITKMRQGEPLSYQNDKFRAQVCRDLPRQRLKLPKETELEFTEKVIRLFAPDLIEALNENTRPIYDHFCQLSIPNRKELCKLLKQLKDNPASTNLSDHGHAAIVQPFKGLPESEQDALLKLAERNANFSFEPNELKEADPESLGYITQIFHQGTLVLPAQVRNVLAEIISENEINADQYKQRLSHTTGKLPSQSTLTHSWPITYTQADSLVQAIETPILQVTTHFHFDTSKDQKSSEFISKAEEKARPIEAQIAENDLVINDLQSEIDSQVENEKHLESPSDQVTELRQTLSPSKKDRERIFQEPQHANAVADHDSYTMKLLSYEVEIKLAHPEVANATQRINDQSRLPTEFSKPFLQVDSNLHASSRLYPEVTGWDQQQTTAEYQTDLDVFSLDDEDSFNEYNDDLNSHLYRGLPQDLY